MPNTEILTPQETHVSNPVEVHFYHPEDGYWVAVGVDGEAHLEALRAGYREGTVIVTPRPSPLHDLVEGEWRLSDRIEAPYYRPLTPREFRDALIDNNILPEDVSRVIQLIPDAKLRAKTLNAWEYPLEFRRDDPLVNQLAASFQLSPEDVDRMWLTATE